MINAMTFNKPEFFNENGVVTDNPPFRDLENVSVWTCYYYMLMLNGSKGLFSVGDIVISLNTAIMSLYGKDDIFHPCPNHYALPEEGMSRDNMMAVVSSGLLTLRLFSGCKTSKIIYDCQKMCKAGIRQYSYRYLQPQDACYFLYSFLVFSKRRWVLDIKKWVLLPLLIPTFLSMSYACLCRKTTRTGAFDTNGILLTYMRMSALLLLFNNSKISTRAFLFFVLTLSKRSTAQALPVSYCIGEYFRNPDHPIHELTY